MRDIEKIIVDQAEALKEYRSSPRGVWTLKEQQLIEKDVPALVEE